MENTNNNLRNAEISKLLIAFGIIISIISLIDLFGIVFPLHLSNVEWVFNVTQGVISSVLAPLLSIVLLLCGFYFNKNSVSDKKILNLEKVVSIIAFGLGLLLIANLLIYSLSLKAYETKVVSSIQTQQETILQKITDIKKNPSLKIPENVYNAKVAEINKAATVQIKSAKKSLFVKNLKSIIELLLYSILSIVVSLIAFNSSKNNLLKLKFAKK